MKLKLDYTNFTIKAYYFLFSFGLGIVFGFLPAYLEAGGLIGRQISSIMSLGSLCGVFGVSILWGLVADRIQKPQLVLKLLAFGTFLGFIPMLFLKTYWPIMGAYLLYSLCSIGIMGILDAVASVRAKDKGVDFGKMRLFAPAGWLFGSVGLGYFIDLTGRSWDDNSVVIAIAGSFGLMFLASLGLRQTTTEKQEVPRLAELKQLFKSKYLVVFYIMALINFVALAAYMVFYGPLIESKGLSPKIVGLSLGVGTLSEVIFMFFFEKIKKWLGLDLIIILSIIISIGRWIIIAYTNNPYVLVGIQVLHSEVGLFVLACVSFVTDTTPRKIVTTGQTVFYTLTYGYGMYIGIMLMGYLKDYYGDPAKLFIASAYIHIIPLLLAFYNYFNGKKIKAENVQLASQK